MKKLILALAISLSIAACSKDKEDCTYVSSDGTYFANHPPTAKEIHDMEDACSCTITIEKTCN